MVSRTTVQALRRVPTGLFAAGAKRASAEGPGLSGTSALLAARGLRPTANRLATLAALQVWAAATWVDPEVIYSEVQRQGVYMHLPTVYKALGELTEAGLAQRQLHPERKRSVFMLRGTGASALGVPGPLV